MRDIAFMRLMVRPRTRPRCFEDDTYRLAGFATAMYSTKTLLATQSTAAFLMPIQGLATTCQPYLPTVPCKNAVFVEATSLGTGIMVTGFPCHRVNIAGSMIFYRTSCLFQLRLALGR